MSSNMSSNFTFLEVSPYYQPNVPEGVTSVSTLAQMEVGCTFSPSKLLAQEEIGPKPFDIQPPRKSVRFSPYQKPSSRYTPQPANLHSSNPQPLIEMTVEPESRHSTPFFSKGPSHPRTDSEEVDGGDDADHGKAHLVIPKPDGESSRPGRGGYNLQKVLGWSRKEYANFKAIVKDLIEEHLDTSQSFAFQKLTSIEVVVQLGKERFPQILCYEDSWPITDLIRQQLTYTSSRARSAKSKVDAEIGKKLRQACGK